MDGNFYGTTNAGGASGLGTIFEWQTGGSYFEMFDFSGDGGLVPGASPNTTLMEDTNGQFYGLMPAGGANGAGVFYTMAPASPVARAAAGEAGRGGEGLLRYSRVSHGRLIFDQAVW
jgi:uncharacterized repeat protein (TIGR03803 family)